MSAEELRTRTGSMWFERMPDRFVVTASGHVGPALVRRDLDLAAEFGAEHPEGWWYVVDTGGVRLPNPLNIAYVRRIRQLPNIRGYVVIAPAAALRMVARLLGSVSRPDAVVRSRDAAERFIATRTAPEPAPLFIYDGDCGFCRRWSAWLARRVGHGVALRPYQAVADLAAYQLAAWQVRRASYLVDEDGRAHGGAAAFAEAFKRGRGMWPVVGYVVSAPGVRALATVVYGWVASNRHRLPAPATRHGGPMGGTPGTRRSYDRVAGRYAERFTTELDGKPFDRDFLDGFAGTCAGRGWVADLGSGPGQIGAHVAVGGASVLAVDVSHEMLRQARALGAATGAVQADVRALPLAGGSVGGAIAFYSLIHVAPDDLPATLAEIGRTLAPGGHLAIAVHVSRVGEPPPPEGPLHVEEMLGEPVDLDFWFYDRARLGPVLDRAGFDVVRATEREPYPPEVESQTRRLYLLTRKR